MLRSVAAILFGLIVVTVLSLGADAALRATVPGSFDAGGRVDAAGLLLLMIGYVAVFIVMGAYAAARTARRRPMLHAIIFGGLMLLSSAGASAAMWDTAPLWYHVTQLLLVLPSAWFGGRMREREIAGYAPHGRTIPAV
jgi:hypothetical protein